MGGNDFLRPSEDKESLHVLAPTGEPRNLGDRLCCCPLHLGSSTLQYANSDPDQHNERDRNDLCTACAPERLVAFRSWLLRQLSEILKHFGGGLVPASAIFFNTTLDDTRDTGWQLAVERGRRGRLRVEDAVENRGHAVAIEGAPSSRHFVKNHAERKQIGALVEVEPERLLGGHIRNCPEGGTRLCKYIFAGHRHRVRGT